MKILLIHRNSFDVIGGVEGTLYCMAESIQNMGHTPVVVARQNQKKGLMEEKTDVCVVKRYSGVRVPKPLLFLEPIFELRNAMHSLQEILQMEHPDLVIVRDNILSYAVSRVYDKQKIVYVPLGVIKYYNTKRSTNSGKAFLIERIRRIQLRIESYYQIKAFNNLPHTAVFSNNMKNQVLKATKGKVNAEVIYPGVSKRYLCDTGAPFDFEKWHANSQNKNFLFVGRLAQEKNLRMLIRAFSHMNNKNTNLWIVGDGPEMATLKKLAESTGVSESVIFTGASKEAERFYHMADFFVLPSYYESFGNVILESMASGTPVIGFKTEPGKTLTAVEELVDDGVTGLICHHFSENALVEAMDKARVLCDDENYFRMRTNCKKHVENCFTWDLFIQKIIALSSGNLIG